MTGTSTACFAWRDELQIVFRAAIVVGGSREVGHRLGEALRAMFEEVVLRQRFDLDLLLKQRIERDGGGARIFQLPDAADVFESGEAEGTIGLLRVRPI